MSAVIRPTIKEENFNKLFNIVGLPKKVMGNSEIGHLNIGGGREFQHILLKINDTIKKKEFSKINEIQNIKKRLNQNKSNLHIIGMYSESGVHSHLNHLKELIKTFELYNIKLHIITDGRDTDKKSAKKYIDKINNIIKNKKIEFTSISGRFYAMDRDKRWERTKKFYNILFKKGNKLNTYSQIIKESYKKKLLDEFLIPTKLTQTKIEKNDEIIFFNFREDRMRQIVSSFQNKFKEFKTNKIKLNITTMYDYEDKIKFKSLFKKIELKNTLSQIISKNKLKQLKIAESEKYAHVTYFFNGGQEKKFKNENRIIIASPKVKTYDQSPKMSAKQITDHIIKNENKFDIIIANFANADMVGHTGNINATKQAVEYLDVCIKKIVKTLNKKTKILITADHGNCENMKGKWNKSHTLSKVPFILLNTNYKKIKSENASLKNIAPTILKLLNIKKSKEMNTKSLI